MNAKKRIGTFTKRCKEVFDAGLALAKASAPKDLVGPWKTLVGPVLVEAKEEKGGRPDRPDSEITLVVKVAGKTLFSAQVYVLYKDKEAREPEHRSERVEKFIPGKWENVLATAFRIIRKSL